MARGQGIRPTWRAELNSMLRALKPLQQYFGRMIDDLLMLTCGWVSGVVTALLIRYEIEESRRPLDPALLPTPVPVPIAPLPALPPVPQLSPYAPKPARRSPHTDRILNVWRAAKQDRPPSWRTQPVDGK